MIIIRVKGGLGNQLYQYAMYLVFKEMGREVRLDITDYLPDAREPEKREYELLLFHLEPPVLASKHERSQFVDDSTKIMDRIRRKLFGSGSVILKETKDYMPEIFMKDNIYLDGFWNCDKYYQDVLEKLQETILFPEEIAPSKTKEILEKISTQNAVSIHIRRGDYVEKDSFYGNICTDEYYDSAMKFIQEKIENPYFYIFSDEPEYVKKKYLMGNCMIVDWNKNQNSLFDMLIMSKCKHNICANSTFSMWGARLNQNQGKQCIRPLKHDNSQKFSLEYMHDTWKNWILIDEFGTLV